MTPGDTKCLNCDCPLEEHLERPSTGIGGKSWSISLVRLGKNTLNRKPNT
jgi:hypothetical protein